MPWFPRKLSLKQRPSGFQLTKVLHRTRKRDTEKEAGKEGETIQTTLMKIVTMNATCGFSLVEDHPPQSATNCPGHTCNGLSREALKWGARDNGHRGKVRCCCTCMAATTPARVKSRWDRADINPILIVEWGDSWAQNSWVPILLHRVPHSLAAQGQISFHCSDTTGVPSNRISSLLPPKVQASISSVLVSQTLSGAGRFGRGGIFS